MNLQKENPVVVIKFPEICVPVEEAENFILAANKFWNDINTTMIQKGEIFKYDTRYFEGMQLPTVKHSTTYSNILDEKLDIYQIDEYVELDDKDGYVTAERIKNCWLCESEDEEEEEMRA